MKPKLFVATKAFINYNGKILILRESLSSSNKFDPGRYDVVGGRIEPGVSMFESLENEIKHQTNLKVVVRKPFYINEINPESDSDEEKFHVICNYFECFANSDEVELREDYDDFLWIDPADFKQYYLFKELHPAFDYYLRV